MNLYHLPVTFLKEVCGESCGYLNMFPILYFLFSQLECNHQQNLKMRGWRKGERKKNERNIIKVYAFSGVNLNWASWFHFATQKKNAGLRA